MKAACPDTNLNGIPSLRKYSRPRIVAARLGVCTRTLRRWADAGKIARHKVGARVVLFDEAEVETFIASTRIQ